MNGNEDAAIETAGRLLLRYGWQPSQADFNRLVGTERQSTLNRIMNDPEAQRRAVDQLRAHDDLEAENLVAMCALRRHADASSRARLLAVKFGPIADQKPPKKEKLPK